MLDERADAHRPEVLAQPVAVVALVGGQNPQLARVSAGELLTDRGITSFPGRRAVNVEDRLALSIDERRRFERLNAVVRALAVVLVRAGALEVGGVNGDVTRGLVQLRRLAQQHSPDVDGRIV
jgi:hypothetical protein